MKEAIKQIVVDFSLRKITLEQAIEKLEKLLRNERYRL